MKKPCGCDKNRHGARHERHESALLLRLVPPEEFGELDQYERVHLEDVLDVITRCEIAA